MPAWLSVWGEVGFTFLALPFWCRLTRVVPEKIQRAVKQL